MSRRVRSIALATCAFLLGILFGPAIRGGILRAEELATIMVRQTGPESASWTIASAGAPVESNARDYDFRAAPGVYTLIIAPPPGFRTETTVIRNGETVSETSSRTVPAAVDAGTLLRFLIEVLEDPEQRGALSVTSTPPGITVVLTTPYGERIVRTPYVDRNAPLGRYSGVFQPRGCPTPAPVSTQLLGGGRAVLHLDFDLQRCSERQAKIKEQTARRRSPERLTRTGGTAPGGEGVPCHPSRVPERSASPLPLGKLRSIQRKEQRLESFQNRLMRPSSLTESSRSRFFGTKPKQKRD